MEINFKIVDSNLDFNSINKDEYENLTDLLDYKSWKNDINVLHILVNSSYDINAKLELKHDKKISSKIYKVRKNLAYSGEPVPPIPMYTGEERIEVSDLLLNSNSVDLVKNEFQSFYIEIKVDSEIAVSNTKVEILLKDLENNILVNKEIELKIEDKIINNTNKFDIELWQYPYRVAEYYKVKPFSDEHFDILRKQLSLYKEVGGEFITATLCEDAWDGQTYGDNDIKYPSMIKWFKNDNSFIYDYKEFDKWVDFCFEEGLGRKIVVYGMAPWHESFAYFENEKLVFEKYDFNSDAHREIWKTFLNDFYKHLEQKNIFDKIYLGIDERGFSKEIFEIVNSVKNSKGETVKIAAAIDNYVANGQYAEMVSHVTVSLIEFEKDRERFYKFLEDRRIKGLDTMLYSCVGHKPGNFSLSEPGETYYTVVSTALSDGFLRWAYDAWVKDPLNDTTHRLFEPGDCFLIYPSLDDSFMPNTSIRMLKIKEALYDVYKLRQLNEDGINVKEVLNSCSTKFLYSREYLTKEQKEILIEDINSIKEIF